uniref:Uncharacterized protein n=1 Tax=Glossina pallidipes TaxID=7398 RepID=A0A1B0A953_GLOPL
MNSTQRITWHVGTSTMPSSLVEDVAPTIACETCNSEFSTQPQLRQHLRRKTCRASTCQFWTADEQHALALIELDMGSATNSVIIDHLTPNSLRTRDAIKKRRQTATYKAILERLRAERSAVQREEEEIPTAETHASVPQETPALEMIQENENEIPAAASASALNIEINAPTGEAGENSINDALIPAIIGLNLDEHDNAIRQQISSTTADQRRELDEWTSALVAS